MEPAKALNRAIRLLEGQLEGDFDPVLAAKAAGMSKEAFSRLFSLLSGMTPAEYIRKRRLTLAAYALRDTNEKVIDIALRFGYESADSFARAFRRQHGFSPSLAREKEKEFRVYPPAFFQLVMKGASEMRVQIIEKQEIRLFGKQTFLGGLPEDRFAAEHTLWASECEDWPACICSRIPGKWYGIWDEGRYAIAREKQDTDGENLEEIRLPASLWAVFTTEKGGFAGTELPALRESVLRAWLPDSGCRITGDRETEVYHLYPANQKKERYYELWIPIERVSPC